MMPSLYEDIINYNILTRLPLKSISRFRCVAKSLSNLFKNPNFAKLQLHHSLKYHNPGILIDCKDNKFRYVDYDSQSSTFSNSVIEISYPVEFRKWQIVDVCNGLILYITDKRDAIIWNPFTNHYLKLPNPPKPSGSHHTFPKILYGFGYDEETEDYKFARIVNSFFTCTELNVYSLATNSWKTMVDIPLLYPSGPLVLFNGIFHWVEFPRPESRLPTIVSFDPDSETYKQITLPQELLSMHEFATVDVRLLEGGLYLVGSYMTGVKVWMMKQYGIEESWTKIFTIDSGKFGGVSGYLNLTNSFGNGVIPIEADEISYLYDLNKKEARKLEIGGIPAPVSTWAFLGSLISPTAGTSLGTQ